MGDGLVESVDLVGDDIIVVMVFEFVLVECDVWLFVWFGEFGCGECVGEIVVDCVFDVD